MLGFQRFVGASVSLATSWVSRSRNSLRLAGVDLNTNYFQLYESYELFLICPQNFNRIWSCWSWTKMDFYIMTSITTFTFPTFSVSCQIFRISSAGNTRFLWIFIANKKRCDAFIKSFFQLSHCAVFIFIVRVVQSWYFQFYLVHVST